MENKTNFLIIVPTLNSYKYLNKLIISLKTQTYLNWRTVFVDSNSSPEHKKYLKSLCSDNRFIILQENHISKGIYQAMSQGVEEAREEDWVIFLGSDDWFNSPFSLNASSSKKHRILSPEFKK